MGATRLCVFLTVLVTVKMVASQPIFGTQLWCDFFCEEDDDDSDMDSDSSSSLEALLDSVFGCGGCTFSTKKPSKTKTTTLSPSMQQPFNIMIPPSNGVNLTMTSTGNSWLMNFMPWAAEPAKATTTSGGTTTAAPATTKAGGTTAAGATTAAATTAAP